MVPQPGYQISAMHILPNTSRSKCNQTMKFGQFIEFTMKKFFVEKSYTKCGEEAVSRPYSKSTKLSISLDQ